MPLWLPGFCRGPLSCDAGQDVREGVCVQGLRVEGPERRLVSRALGLRTRDLRSCRYIVSVCGPEDHLY